MKVLRISIVDTDTEPGVKHGIQVPLEEHFASNRKDLRMVIDKATLDLVNAYFAKVEES